MARASMGITISPVGVVLDSWDSYVKKMFLTATDIHVQMEELVMMKSTTSVALVPMVGKVKTVPSTLTSVQAILVKMGEFAQIWWGIMNACVFLAIMETTVNIPMDSCPPLQPPNPGLL